MGEHTGWHFQCCKSGDLTKWLDVVTFNYERSFDWMLHHRLLSEMKLLKSRFDADKEENAQDHKAINILNAKIVHVYGVIGQYPHFPYGETEYQGSRSELETITNALHKDTEDLFAKARTKLRDAERVFVIGFSFHPVSMQKLDCDLSCKEVDVIAGPESNQDKKRQYVNHLAEYGLGKHQIHFVAANDYFKTSRDFYK